MPILRSPDESRRRPVGSRRRGRRNIRSDIGPEDLLRALAGVCYMHDQPGWQATVLRPVDVFVDGLCVQTGINKRTKVVSQAGDVTERVKERSPRRGSQKRHE
jgi:hypothetical protein